MQPFIDEHGLDGFDHVFDDDLELWIAFGVNNQPAFVFIDETGSADVLIRMLGEDAIEARLDALVAPA